MYARGEPYERWAVRKGFRWLSPDEMLAEYGCTREEWISARGRMKKKDFEEWLVNRQEPGKPFLGNRSVVDAFNLMLPLGVGRINSR